MKTIRLHRSRFGLRGSPGDRIARRMSARGLILLAAGLMVVSCKEEADVVVAETRPLTTKDEKPRLFATSDERFRNAKPSPVQGDMPENWREVPGTEMRLLNYRFGESGLGEVWVSISSGTVLENINRWYQQFEAPVIDAAGLETIRKVPIMGVSGAWVEAQGEYASGMGSPPKPGYGLAGVVAEIGGRILTVKMVGPAAEVEAARASLEAYAATVRMTDG